MIVESGARVAAELPEWNPNHVDLTKPNAARMYDWYLGGAHNFDVDREFGRRMLAIWPGARAIARINREFLQRVVRDSVRAGVRQFLDIGSGVPTVGNVHEIALAERPDARVVYVDYEPIAFQTAQLLLTQQEITGQATIIQEDLRRPEGILDHPETRRLLDFGQPICVLMVALLHFVPESAGPRELIATFRDRVAPGSRLVISHGANDGAAPELAAKVIEFTRAYRDTSNPMFHRTRAEVTALFDGWRLLDPGVVFAAEWRPDHAVDTSNYGVVWGGVGELPA